MIFRHFAIVKPDRLISSSSSQASLHFHLVGKRPRWRAIIWRILAACFRGKFSIAS